MPTTRKRVRGVDYNTTRTGRVYRKRARRGGKGYTRTAGYYGRFMGKSGENKFFDTLRGSQAANAAGTIIDPSLCLIPQGVTESTRVGRKCVIKSLHLKGELRLPNFAAGDQCDLFRLIIYVDKQTNGAAATASDILEASVTLHSFRNLANSGRFRILLDKVYPMNSQAGEGNGTTFVFNEFLRSLNINKKLNLPLEFSCTTDAITELRSNNIGVLGVSHGGYATISYKARVRFSD